jgi:hypothetical protein
MVRRAGSKNELFLMLVSHTLYSVVNDKFVTVLAARQRFIFSVNANYLAPDFCD